MPETTQDYTRTDKTSLVVKFKGITHYEDPQEMLQAIVSILDAEAAAEVLTRKQGRSVITAGLVTVAVAFGTAFDDTDYNIELSCDELTTIIWANKAAGGFNIEIGATLGADLNIDWTATHDDFV